MEYFLIIGGIATQAVSIAFVGICLGIGFKICQTLFPEKVTFRSILTAPMRFIMSSRNEKLTDPEQRAVARACY